MSDARLPEHSSVGPCTTEVAALTWAAFGAALLGTLGSLYLSIGMGLKACPLCFYQRTFIMGALGVLGTGLLIRPRTPFSLNLLALPLALGGLGVALFHVNLELNGTLECPAGILGLGTAPQQSLAILIILVTLLALSIFLGLRQQAEPMDWKAILGGVVLGVLFTVGCILSTPPSPRSAPYQRPVDICKPIFHPPQ